MFIVADLVSLSMPVRLVYTKRDGSSAATSSGVNLHLLFSFTVLKIGSCIVVLVDFDFWSLLYSLVNYWYV